MSLPKITHELAEALQKLVAADVGLREAACSKSKYDQAVTRFDRAAEQVARKARLAGFEAGAR